MVELKRGVRRRLIEASLLALAVGMGTTIARAETLEETLASAYAANAQLNAERAQLEVTNEDVPQALANWRPTVSIVGQEGIDHQSDKENCADRNCLPASFGIANSSSVNLSPQSYGVTVTQPIFRGGQTVAQTEEALNLVRSERANLVATEEAVLLQVTSDYLNVLEQHDLVDLNAQNERILLRLKDGTADRFRLGELTHTDAEQAEGFYTQAIAQRQLAVGQFEIARAAFEHDVGHAPGELVPPKARPVLTTSRQDAVEIAAMTNPNVIRSQFARQAAEDNVRVVRGQLLPTLVVQGSVERQKEASTPRLTTDIEQIIAQLSMPLYEGGAIYSQSRAAQKTVSLRQAQIDDARRAAVQSAGQAWDGMGSAREAIKSLEESVRSDEQALKGIQEEEAVGSRTLQDVLIQEQTLFQARVALVQTQHDETAYEFALAAALGRLTAKNLALPVDYYDPDVEFDAVRDKWLGFGTDK